MMSAVTTAPAIIFTILGALPAQSAPHASLSNSFGLGVDYSSQAYRTGIYDTLHWEWLERDTLDLQTEAGSFWGLKLGVAGGKTSLDADNNLRISTGSVRERLGLELGHNLARSLKLSGKNDLEMRYYHRLLPQLADTSYTRNYLNNTGELGLSFEPDDLTRLGVSDGVELQRYAQPDSFSYDYLLNRLRFSAGREIGLLTNLDAGYSWQRRWSAAVPDRNYYEHSAEAGLDQYLESGLHVGFDDDLRRRRYPQAEHSFWEEHATITLGQDLSSLGYEIEVEPRWTWYDSATEVYANLCENTVKLAGKFQPRPEFSIRVGPQLDRGSGLSGPSDQEYREVSLPANLDLFQTDRFWLSFEERPGRRSYPHADSAYHSAYWFNELNLMLNWTLLSSAGGALQLEGMANITPEWHVDRSDNTSLGMYSIEFRYGPR